MPYLGPQRLTDAVVNSTKLAVTQAKGLLLRPERSGVYDPTADLVAEFATYPNFEGTGVSALWSVGLDADLNDGTVDFQFSADNGVTWKFWNGAWAAAGAGDWTSLANARNNIATFPFGSGSKRGIRMKVRLNPDTTLKKTPVVRDAFFLVEHDHDPVADLLRSMRAKLLGLTATLYEHFTSTGTNTVTLGGFGFNIAGVQAAYNLTDDPGRGTNIFQAYNAGTKVVTFTGAQTAADLLEVRFTGLPSVVLTPKAVFTNTKIPIIEIELRGGEVSRVIDTGIVSDVNVETKVGRVRPGVRYIQADLVIHCVDKDEERAHAIASLVRRRLEEDDLVSLATYAVLEMANVEFMAPRIMLADQVFDSAVGAAVWVAEDWRQYDQDALATQIDVRVSSRTEIWYDAVTSVT